ncbi:MAG: hypothetical protein V4568_13810, partial [Pseudomonadota bacterium]
DLGNFKIRLRLWERKESAAPSRDCAAPSSTRQHLSLIMEASGQSRWICGYKLCLLSSAFVARRCHSVSYGASSRLGSRQNPSISIPQIQRD